MASIAAAIGSFVAAGAALWIATRDRKERQHERIAADKAQARLIYVKVRESRSGPDFTVEITNYGTRAVLNVEFDKMAYESFPNARPDTDPRLEVLDNGKSHTFSVGFRDERGNSVITDGRTDNRGVFYSEHRDATRVTAIIRFEDAHGNRWKRSNTGLVELIRD